MSRNGRKAKEETTEVDLSKPLNLDNFDLSTKDCFGRLWKPDDRACAICADVEVCGIIYQHQILPNKVKKIKKEKGVNYLDEVNFDRIPKDKLYKEIQTKSGEISVSKLVNFVKQYSKCDDMGSVKVWIKNFKKEYNVKIQKGLVYAE